VPDLHKHFVDGISGDCPKCKTKEALKRTPEVLDCWFESGSMPYAQEHYPFENTKEFEGAFPADFIAEGLDQTRGWFYTLTVLSTALFNKPAFKNCVVNGIVLAEDGRKMSKRLKNYPDPNEIFTKYGADALRLYLMQSPAMHADELRFSEKSLLELMRAVMIPLWNAYGFFASYANIDGWRPKQDKPQALSMLDAWILARAKDCEKSVHECMEQYRISEIAPLLVDFIDDLTNWYIRLNRERFWSQVDKSTEADKNAAYSTLWTVLNSLSMMLAPSLPFYAELLHGALRGIEADEFRKLGTCVMSVHENLFENADSLKLSTADTELLAKVKIAKSLILLGRSLRGEAKIGLRQPLSSLRIAGLSREEADRLDSLRDLVCKEVNVKTLTLVPRASDLVEESVKPNHRVLGKKVGGMMKEIQAELAKWDSAKILAFETKRSAIVCGFECGVDDIQIVRKAKDGRFAQAGYGLVAELDTALSPELVREGLQREIVNRIQQRRKELKLHLADRIEVSWFASPNSLVEEILNAEQQAPGLVAGETLTTRFLKSTAALEHAEDFSSHGQLSFDIQRA